MNEKYFQGIWAGCVMVLLVAVYFGISFYFDQVFCPNTFINGIEVSGMQPGKARNLLEENEVTYALQITTRDDTTDVLDGRMFDYDYSFDAIDTLKAQEMGWSWIIKFFTQTDYDVKPVYIYDEAKLDTCIEALPCMTQEMVAPVNASIRIDDTGFHLTEESQGNTLNKDRVKQVITEAVLSGETEIDLDELDCYEKPAVTMESEEIQNALKEVDELCYAEITYDFHGNEEKISTEQIRQWVRRNGDGKLYISWDAAYDYMYSLAEKYDTINSYREFKTSHGTTVTLRPGNYGWGTSVTKETNLLMEDIENHRTVSREPSYYMTPYDYLDPDSPDDIGFTYIEIDLSSQYMWYYLDGELFLETPITSGTMSTGHGTPAGVYYIYNRLEHVTLVGDNYRTPVNYWMQVNGGIGIHDSLWRSAYGGTEYLYNGSHGCINTPYWAVESLFYNVTVGTPVVMYY